MPSQTFNGLSVTPAQPTNPAVSTNAWRPPEWSKPQLTTITIPAPAAEQTTFTINYETGDSQSGGSQPTAAPPPIVLVFDSVLKIEHERVLRCTEHPIQTSSSSPVSSVTDHAYQDPAVVTLDILMSDVADSYSPGAWTGSSSKSVSAYQAILALQTERTLVTLTTRLDTYTNMLVAAIHTPDTQRTRHGLRATVVFRKVPLAGTTFTPVDDTAQPASARQHLTDSSPAGTVQPDIPASAKLAPNHIPPGLQGPPGAGSWSSTNATNLSDTTLTSTF